jgi:cytochrome c-type biogenesis protein
LDALLARALTAIETDWLAAAVPVLLAGVFVGLTPGAYLAGPAVLGYLATGAEQRTGLLRRASAYVVGAALPMALLGFLLGAVGDWTAAVLAQQVVWWNVLVALVIGWSGLLLTGIVVLPIPAFLPLPRVVASSRDAFLMGVPLGIAACPACTPMLFPIASAAILSGGPAYGAALLLIFGLGRGVPILAAAASLDWLRTLRLLVPSGLWLQRAAGWLLVATAAVYLVQAALVASGRPALFAAPTSDLPVALYLLAGGSSA